MLGNYRSLLLGLLTLGALCIASELLSPAVGLQPVLLDSARPARQKALERSWRDPEWQKAVTVEFAPSGLGTASFLRLDRDGNLLFFDDRSQAIYRLLRSGQLERKVAIPSSILKKVSAAISDVAFGDDGTVWVCGASGVVAGFRGPDEIRNAWAVSPNAHKIESIGDQVVVMHAPGARELFAIHRATGELIASFGTLLEHQDQTGVALTGWMTVGSDRQSIVFAPRYGGLLGSYGLDGKTRFFTETIDRPELPKLGKRTEKNRRSHAKSTDISSVSVRDEWVYVLAHLTRPEGVLTVVDRYSEHDGSYHDSFTLPERYNAIKVAGDALYVRGKESVVVWRRQASARANE
jgi:hypothetical protein